MRKIASLAFLTLYVSLLWNVGQAAEQERPKSVKIPITLQMSQR
jgi:hypothetical protein